MAYIAPRRPECPHIVMALVMTYIGMAYIIMAYLDMACIGMACIVMAKNFAPHPHTWAQTLQVIVGTLGIMNEFGYIGHNYIGHD